MSDLQFRLRSLDELRSLVEIDEDGMRWPAVGVYDIEADDMLRAGLIDCYCTEGW